MGRTCKALGLVCLLLLLMISAVKAQWIKEGMPICTIDGNQVAAQIIQDGFGGVIITWEDRRGADTLIYAQRIDSYGKALWLNGIRICASNASQKNPQLVSDGAGGAIIAWEDYRFDVSTSDIWAQRVDAYGDRPWGPMGKPIADTVGNYQDNVRMISTGSGGAIIVWQDCHKLDWSIYAQKIDGISGARQWPSQDGSDGVIVCNDSGDQKSPAMISDGAGGAIVAYRSTGATTGHDISAARISSSGVRQWNNNLVCAAAGDQDAPELVPDDAGGSYIVWSDWRSDRQLYAQRVKEDGSCQWTENGIRVSTLSGWQEMADITSDDAGNAIITWRQPSAALPIRPPYIYAQKLDWDGNTLWTSAGVMICQQFNDAFPTARNDPQIVSDGAGGAIITWDDGRNKSSQDIYVQRIEPLGGDNLWPDNGIAVCMANQEQIFQKIVSDGAGGAIILWEDYRHGKYNPPNSENSDVYVQRIDHNGYWGYPAPIIDAIRDVPGDQGGSVNLSWRASRLDIWPENVVTRYTIWRAIDPTQATLALKEGASILLSAGDPIPEKVGSAIRIEQRAGQAYYWKLITSVEACNMNTYSEVAPTLFDSTSVCDELHHFQIIAHADAAYDPNVYWISTPVAGYSVDNLAPDPPAKLFGMGIVNTPPRGLQLSWDQNAEADLSHYTIHRGPTEDFIPNASNRIGTTSDHAFIDPSWTVTDRNYYRIAAVDIHENTGFYALLKPQDIVIGVLLQSYAASLTESGIEISWTLREPVEKSMHHVLRSSAGESDFEELSSADIIENGLTFSFEDRSIEPGMTYRYRVEIEKAGGQRMFLLETKPISTPAIPLTLFQNQPNPFNPSTTIRFYLPEPVSVTLGIYDSSGRVVATLIGNELRSKGYQEVHWTGTDNRGRGVASGIYFYRLATARETKSRKMILLR